MSIPNFKTFLSGKSKICVIGLGYVGLPLAVLLNKKFSVIGYDIDETRINQLKKNFDSRNELSKADLSSSCIDFTCDPAKISCCDLIIITVPTPVDRYKKPNLKPLKAASEIVGQNMNLNSVIVYESTVYPGVIEDICIPILEKKSNLKWKKSFFVGYSPERVNPGDKVHPISEVKKIIAGDTKETADLLEKIYGSVIKAGIYKASNIKIAEAAKVIENIQRDLNIALINELSIIFNKIGLDTKEVLEAASTKWNFLKFEPGLVGGHCIGVDPYYLTFKAESLGYNPQVILAGRRINDSMGIYIAEKTIKKIIEAGNHVKGGKILILGFTFKENINDIRNTKVFDIYNELIDYGITPYIYDPHVDPKDAKKEYGINLLKSINMHAPYDAIILAVKHNLFLKQMNFEKYKKLSKPKTPVLIDVKGVYEHAEKNGLTYWRL